MSRDGRETTPENGTMLQGFEWYVSNNGEHFQRLNKDVSTLRDVGISAIWIPPACKGNGGTNDVGYGIYDLWDIGEFDQKGTVRTKYGTVEDLTTLSKTCDETGMKLYFDAVLNHKAGADKQERCRAQQVDSQDRLKDIGSPTEIDAWVGFDFKGEFTESSGRGTKYSDMVWHWYHFDGADHDGGIYRMLGDNMYWATDVDNQYGNYDYLMFSDIDHRHPEVKADMLKWGLWVSKRLKLHGMRFDAVKHYSEYFLLNFIDNLTQNHRSDFFCVGEFWKDDIGTICAYLDRMKHQFSIFDTPLVYNFSAACHGNSWDMTQIFNNTLVQARPISAVTLVMNHDTQPGQALETPITDWFKPLAYALILLRESGYPCVFYGDLYGTLGPDWRAAGPACGGQLGDLVLARKLYAYGEQNDYFDFRTCIGWVRRGTWDRPHGCAVVLSNAGDGWKRMYAGTEHRGEVWTDVLGWSKDRAIVGDDGFAVFKCYGCSVSVYVSESAKGREQFGTFKGRFSAQG